MNFFDMTRDDWIFFAVVMVTLALPSIIKPTSLWLGKRLGLVAESAEESSVQAMQNIEEAQDEEAAQAAEQSESKPETPSGADVSDASPKDA